MDLLTPIIKQIESLGYAVSIHQVNGVTEMHAAKLDGTEAPHVARCSDGDGPEETYRCARMLARAVGIELEDG